jgi:hypothetical protein
MLDTAVSALNGPGSDLRDDYDRDYADALLDYQLHRFMQAEYGGLEPPAGVFQRVLQAIEAGASALRPPARRRSRRGYAALPTRCGAALTGLAGTTFKALTRPAASRLFSGGLALALALAVLGGDNSWKLQSPSATSTTLYQAAPASATPGSAECPVVEEPTALAMYIANAPATTYEYDPAELHRLPITRPATARPRTEQVDPEERQRRGGSQF